MNKTEQKLENEIKKEEKEIKKLRLSLRATVALVLILATIGGAIAAYLVVAGRSVYIEKSSIAAPEIDLASSAGGVLEDMLVKDGQTVGADQVVARVGNELIKAKRAGIVTKADAAIGESFKPGQAVVAMIDPSALRVVGQLDENKGLSRIRIGQYAVFTVDAFGSRQFSGVVDEVSPTSKTGDVVFQISDKRAEQVFNVKVRYDATAYPELKDGMSARLWVYTK